MFFLLIFQVNKTYFVVVIAVVAIMINLTQAAPKFQHRKRHLRYLSDDEHKQKLEWVNPCRGKLVATTSPNDQTNEINQSYGHERKKIVSTYLSVYTTYNTHKCNYI